MINNRLANFIDREIERYTAMAEKNDRNPETIPVLSLQLYALGLDEAIEHNATMRAEFVAQTAVFTRIAVALEQLVAMQGGTPND